jgi:sterol desaturase/sphingolipid hydroxylase (fatty acid hydroxylase superfamily)
VAEVLYYAIPAFVLLLAAEMLSFRYQRDDDLVGYESKDTRTSLAMGGGNVLINAVWKLAVLVAYAGLYELTPLRMPADEWWTYVLLFFADDLAYYWFHRIHHEVRVFWASHVVHHSSRHYNLSTALRQTWTPMTALPFWAPLALVGFAPWMILLQQSISLIYQFWIHTERVKKLPAPVEFVFNTPSHHRVHHGANEVYLDRNYGGILIVWDRLFGSFQGRDRARPVRPDEEHPHVPPDPRRLPRVPRPGPRRAGRGGLAGAARLPLPGSRLVSGRQRRRHLRLSPGAAAPVWLPRPLGSRRPWSYQFC